MEEMRIVEAVVKRYRRAFPWLDARDLLNQAMVQVLAERHKRDLARPLAAYLAMVRAISWRELRDYMLFAKVVKLPQRASRRQYQDLRERIQLVPIGGDANYEPNEADRHPDVYRPEPAPSDELLDEADWKSKVCGRMREVFDGLGRDGVLAGEVLLGEEPSAAVAGRHGVPVREVYCATRRAKRRVAADDELRRLARRAGMWRDDGGER